MSSVGEKIRLRLGSVPGSVPGSPEPSNVIRLQKSRDNHFHLTDLSDDRRAGGGVTGAHLCRRLEVRQNLGKRLPIVTPISLAEVEMY